jgi:hypothetical protein
MDAPDQIRQLLEPLPPNTVDSQIYGHDLNNPNLIRCTRYEIDGSDLKNKAVFSLLIPIIRSPSSGRRLPVNSDHQ